MKHKKTALGAFPDTEKASDRTLFDAIKKTDKITVLYTSLCILNGT
jgi:hypothetical protein